MNKNDKEIFEYFKIMYKKYKNNYFVKDKTGAKLVELLNVSLKLNPKNKIIDLGERKTPINYAKSEVEWYDSQSLYVKDIPYKTPQIWKQVSDDNGKINSNYGWIIYSKENCYQYKNCLEELKNNKASRRAMMIYQRPSIWEEYNKNNMGDFICTDNVQCFIRDNKLIYIITQRSCDLIYGFFNDYYWHATVYNRFFNDLKEYYKNLKFGKILYNIKSLHIYDKHFDLMKKVVKNKEG